jgi:hypothetical protein
VEPSGKPRPGGSGTARRPRQALRIIGPLCDAPDCSPVTVFFIGGRPRKPVRLGHRFRDVESQPIVERIALGGHHQP